MNRRAFLEMAALVAGAATASAAPIEEVPVTGLQEGMRSGRYTARALAEQYLSRIQHGPKINAVIEMNPDALSIAAALDAERKAGHIRGPLHGIPVLIKDNIDTHDRMRTSAGSLALATSTPAQDSFVAQRLRAAGAVILGKTNLSEWANFRSSHSVSGWSGRGGQTHNPYALDRNPCGSSSGSGAAVSANLCALAVGTETDGSIVCPASMNGVVGIKPTLGLISRAGIVPIAHSQDTAGPMARTVADAAALLTALTGIDPRDHATNGQRAERDYTAFLDPNGLRGARIGVARKFFGFNEAVDKLMEASLAAMKSEGAEIVDPADLPSHGKAGNSEMEVLLYEFKADLNTYLQGLGPNAPVKSLADVIAFNEQHKREEMPYFGQDIMQNAQKKGPLSDKDYRDALEKNHKLFRDEGIDAVISKHKVHAIVGPTAGPAWTTDWVNGDHDSGGCSTPAAVAGYPHITVPAGFVFGLPVGISFFGPAWSEATLLKIAYGFERTTKARRPPRFLATAPLQS